MLTPAEIAQFRAQGYIAIPRLIEGDDIELLREAYDCFLRGEIACGRDDRQLGNRIRQILWPSRYHPVFADNTALRKSREIARQLLGIDEPAFRFDMLINKEPGNLSETPWHQDYSYSGEPFTPAGTPIPNRQLQFWVALDDVDESNGCMHFVGRAHTGLLSRHYVAGGEPTDPHRLLAMMAAPDPSLIVACPLRAGDCTIHYEGTPHFTSSNRTLDRQRRAYIYDFNWMD